VRADVEVTTCTTGAEGSNETSTSRTKNRREPEQMVARRAVSYDRSFSSESLFFWGVCLWLVGWLV
jgi:hypothetical protein